MSYKHRRLTRKGLNTAAGMDEFEADPPGRTRPAIMRSRRAGRHALMPCLVFAALILTVFPNAFADEPGVLNLRLVGHIINTEDLELRGADGIATFESGGTLYAAVASCDDDGVQILSLADPASPTAVGRIGDNGSRLLDGAADVATFESGGTAYAVVAASIDDGVQILKLANPADPATVGSIQGDALLLDGANAIAIFKSGGITYAAVAAFNDDGVQIIRLVNPSSPRAVGSIGDSRSRELNGANAIDIFNYRGTTYAAIPAYYDRGVQVIGLADPANPTAAAGINDKANLELGRGRGVTAFESGGAGYLAVTSFYVDHGVEILGLNHSPTVGAGTDRTVVEGETVTLSGTASDPENDNLTYLWTHDSSLSIGLADDTASMTSFTAPAVAADTTVTFTLTADDGTDATADTVVITILKKPPAILVMPASLEVREGASADYSVVLQTGPSADVTVTIGGVSGDLEVDKTSLVFTPGNWNSYQTVRVTAADDADSTPR